MNKNRWSLFKIFMFVYAIFSVLATISAIIFIGVWVGLAIGLVFSLGAISFEYINDGIR